MLRFLSTRISGTSHSAPPLNQVRTTMCPIIRWLLVAIALPACAGKGSSEEEVVSTALDSIELCYHWAEEVGGGGDEERSRAIDEGFGRDCPDAQARARQAYALYPKNRTLALGLLKLNDIGYFELAEDEKNALCQGYSILAKQEFLGS